MKRFRLVLTMALMMALAVIGASFAQGVTRYVRYEHNGTTSYGILEGDIIHQLRGNIFESPQRTGTTVPMGDVTLLVPSEPTKVMAAGFNYRSHIGQANPAEYPGLFDKHASSLIPHEATVAYYEDATDLHFEGEMVLIIGKRARNVSVADAPDYIFAVAPGNDIGERAWQSNDLQWFRAKGADTFGPVGPVMVRGVHYDDLLLQTRVNGEVMQSQRTRDLIFDSSFLVSYISRYVTLEPGDMIFTGTPGATSAMQPGDVVEVELENVGILRNTIGEKGAGAFLLPVDTVAQQSNTREDPAVQKVEPFQVFDNLYHVGIEWVSMWVLETSEGLILFDSLCGEWVDHAMDGIEKLGLDPSDIKYVLPTHGHFDHVGGAGRFQEVYGATVGMIEEDWDMVESGATLGGSRLVRRDLVIEDGDTLTLGDTTLTFYQTPGHTPGMLSARFTVYDNGEPHVAFMFGGVGLNFRGVDRTEMYIDSVKRLMAMEGLEVNIPYPEPRGNGPGVRARRAVEDPRPECSAPFVDRDGFKEWLDQLLANAETKLEEEKTAVGG